MCKDSSIKYRCKLEFPADLTPKFDYKFATALWDLGGAVGDAHCRENIPMPPPCDQHRILYGGETTDI